VRRPPSAYEIQRHVIGTHDREFTRYSQTPVGASFAIAGIGEAVTSVDRMPASATGNRVNPLEPYT